MKCQTRLATAILGIFGALGCAGATVFEPSQPPIPFATLSQSALPGTSAPPPGPSLNPGGTLLDTLITTLVAATFSGTVRTAVYERPEPGAGLDFYYQFSNDAQSQNAIARLTAASFQGFTTDVFQLSGGFGVFEEGNNPAATADRSSDGKTIGFNFTAGTENALDPGDTSYVLVIRTDAPHYVQGTMGIINGSAESVLAFAPIPEPETYALMLAGLGLLGYARRRNLKHAKSKSKVEDAGNNTLPAGKSFRIESVYLPRGGMPAV